MHTRVQFGIFPTIYLNYTLGSFFPVFLRINLLININDNNNEYK